MSVLRYVEVCIACEAVLAQHQKTRESVVHFLRSRFIPGLVAYLGCPAEHVWMFDYNGSRYEDFSLRSVLRPDSGLCWNIGLVVRIDGGRRFVDFQYLLRCRWSDGPGTVEIAGRQFAIDDDGLLNECFAHLVSHLSGQVQRGLTDRNQASDPWRVAFSPAAANFVRHNDGLENDPREQCLAFPGSAGKLQAGNAAA